MSKHPIVSSGFNAEICAECWGAGYYTETEWIVGAEGDEEPHSVTVRCPHAQEAQ